MISDAKRIDEVLWQNSRNFDAPGWVFAVDSNLDRFEDWETSKLKVLIQFLSAGESRAVSSTDIALISLIKGAVGDDAFVDTCFLPSKRTGDMLEKLGIPWSFGNVSHHPIQDYDVVIISNSVIEEKYNLFPIFDKSNFPLYSTQRLDDSNMPLVLYGGAGCSEAEPLYGKSADGQQQSLIDVSYIGYAEPHMMEIAKDLVRLQSTDWMKDTARLLTQQGFDVNCIGIKGRKHEVIDMLMEKYDCIYNPRAYDHLYEDDNWSIREIKKINSKAPDRVQYAQVPLSEVNSRPGFERKIIYNQGNYDSTDIQISWGCGGTDVCSFCAEGNHHGWRQKSLEKIKVEAMASRRYALSSVYNNFSFNTNFHTHYEDIMQFVAGEYPRLTAIGMRADEIAARPDYFFMNKHLGLNKITLGVEGISDRIRNGYLNKTLSEEQLTKACKAVFENKFMGLKLYFILTGRETNEDWDEGIGILQRLVLLRDSLGANTHIRLTFSILCHYPHTPIAWDERTSVIHTINHGKITYFMEKAVKLGLTVRFTSRGKAIAFQQMNIDAGRVLTAAFEKCYKETGWVYYRNVPDDIVDNLIGQLKGAGIDFYKMLQKRDYDFIFPSDTIHIKNTTVLIKASKRINEYVTQQYCLKTQAQPAEGRCGACGLCHTKDEIQDMTKRPLKQSKHSVQDVITTLAVNRPKYRYRFVFDVPKKYDFLDKRPLAHYWFAQYFTSEEMNNVFGVVSGSDPVRWNNNSEFRYPVHGKYIFDIHTKEPMEFREEYPEHAALKFNNVFEVASNFNIAFDDYVITVMETKAFPELAERFRNKAFNKYPFMADNAPVVWDEMDSIEVHPLLKKTDNYKFFFCVPLKANLIKFISQTMRKPYNLVIRDVITSMTNVLYFRVVQGYPCRICAKDSVMNLGTGKMIALCPEHLTAATFSKLSK